MQNFTLMQDNDLRNDFKLVTAEIRQKEKKEIPLTMHCLFRKILCFNPQDRLETEGMPVPVRFRFTVVSPMSRLANVLFVRRQRARSVRQLL